MMTDVLNREELGKKYFNYTLGSFYLRESVWKAEEVFIDRVVIIKDHTEIDRRTISGAAGGIVGAIIAGFAGWMFAMMVQPEWETDMDVYLTDGRVVEIRVTSKAFLKVLMRYTRRHNYHSNSEERRSVYQGNKTL